MEHEDPDVAAGQTTAQALETGQVEQQFLDPSLDDPSPRLVGEPPSSS